MEGFAPIIFLATLAEPVVAVSAIAGGLAARRKWHLLPASLLAPAAYLAFEAIFGTGADHFGTLFPFLAVAGAIWSGIAFAVRSTWRS